MTYVIVNAFFLAVVALAVIVASPRGTRSLGRWWAGIGLTLVVLLVMTAIFDNILILVGIVAYNDDAVLGINIGVAPIEDFAYAIAAVLLLPSLWLLIGHAPRSARRRGQEQAATDADAGQAGTAAGGAPAARGPAAGDNKNRKTTAGDGNDEHGVPHA